MKMRKRGNHIVNLRDEHDNIKLDMDGMKVLVKNFFKNLYTTEHDLVVRENLRIFNCPKLSSDVYDDIQKAQSDEEIKNAIYSVGALRTLGPDSLHALFFSI